MDFLELKEIFENKLKNDCELLEFHFAPYSFGSGMTAYRIKGQIIKVIYDGKENQVELLVSAKHDKYSNASWTTIYSGVSTDFIENGLLKLSILVGKNTETKK